MISNEPKAGTKKMKQNAILITGELINGVVVLIAEEMVIDA